MSYKFRITFLLIYSLNFIAISSCGFKYSDSHSMQISSNNWRRKAIVSSLIIFSQANLGDGVRYDRLYLPKKINSKGKSFIKTAGGSNEDIIYAIEPASNNNLMLAGSTKSNGAGGKDMFIANYSPRNNKYKCYATLGSSDDDEAFSMVKIDSYYYLTGNTNNDLLFAKFNETCDLEFDKKISGSGVDVGYSITNNQLGEILISGGTTSWGGGSYDALTILCNTTAYVSWLSALGGNNVEIAYGITNTQDGDPVIVGQSNTGGFGNGDILLAKLYLKNGVAKWIRAYGGNQTDCGYSVTEISNANIMLTGYTKSIGYGNQDIAVMEVSDEGTFQWGQFIGGENVDIGSMIKYIPSKQEVIVGGYTNSINFNDSYDSFLFKYNSSKAITRSIYFGGTDADYLYDVIQINKKAVYAVGRTRSYGLSSYDGFLAKFPRKLFSKCSTVYRPKIDDARRLYEKENKELNQFISSSIQFEDAGLQYKLIDTKKMKKRCKSAGFIPNVTNIFIICIILLYCLVCI